MALSGSFMATTSQSTVDAYIYWSATQNIANNTSTVTAYLTYKRNNSWTGVTSGRWNGSITIDGQTVEASHSTINITKDGGWIKSTNQAGYTAYNSDTYPGDSHESRKIVKLADKVVNHNADGSKSITISATGNMPGIGLTTTIAATITLDTIPRTSTVSATSANIGSASTITISRASDSFTHTLTYSFIGLSGTIAVKTASTSIAWTLPTSFYAKIPNAQSGVGTITCQTYSGSTLIGSSTCNFTALVAASNAPTVSVSAANTDTTLTGSASKVIAGVSSVRVQTTATAKNSASISSISVVNGGVTKSGADVTFSGVVSGYFKITVIDSRGFSTIVEKNLTVINYIKPTTVVEGSLNTDGVISITIKGNIFNGSLGAVNNSKTVNYRINEGSWVAAAPTYNGNTYEASLSLSGYNYRNSYKIESQVVDSIQTITSAAISVSCFPLFDWGNDNFNFNIPVNFNAGINIDLIYPVGSIYMNISEVNPSNLFGGTWERLKDRFLLGVGDTYAKNTSGGSATHTLTANEMPSHTHTQNAHAHNVRYKGFKGLTPSQESGSYYVLRRNDSGDSYDGTDSDAALSATPTNQNTGGGQAHNNMPPYLTVYMWKRTA